MPMTIALWCVLIAGLMPYLIVGIAKGGGGYDNREPRRTGMYAKALQQRAYAAHKNAFEAFPLFAAAVLLASLSRRAGGGGTIDAMAAGWVALRIAYVACYLTDRATLRSLVWTAALADAVAIFTSPAWLRG